MSKWIVFEEQDIPGKKTILWIVLAKDGRTELGEIKWFGRWRGYAFFPKSDTVYEEDCLRDIANFVQEKTNKHFGR